MEGNQIKLLTEVQGAPYGRLDYLEGVEDTATAFDVLYSADGFRFGLTDL